MQYVKHVITLFMQFLLTIWVGDTIVFFVPRIIPSANPITLEIQSLRNNTGGSLSEHQLKLLENRLYAEFGLQGSVWSQYVSFLKRVFINHDFGPSLSMYPTPVSHLIGHALPWSLGLLITSLVVGWILGNGTGLFAAFLGDKAAAIGLEIPNVVLQAVPYVVFTVILQVLFTFVWPVFPVTTSIHGTGWARVSSVIFNSTLPALSIILTSIGGNMLSMKALAMTTLEEDYVGYARLKGLSNRRVMTSYVMRNAMLPQVTGLAIGLGGAFGGALFTEALFGYPGIGTLLYGSITVNDYNTMMGTVSIAIIGVAGAMFLVNLLYPLFDPRIRYK